MVLSIPNWNSIEIDVPEYMNYNGKARLSLTPDNRIKKIDEINSIKLVPKDILEPQIILRGSIGETNKNNKPKQKILKISNEPELTDQQRELMNINKAEFIRERNRELQEIKAQRAPEIKRIRSESMQRSIRERREQPPQIQPEQPPQIQQAPQIQIQQPQRIVFEDLNTITKDAKEKIIIGNFNTEYITGILKINNRLLYTQIINYLNKKVKYNNIVVLDEIFKLPRFEKTRLFDKLFYYYTRFRSYDERRAIETILNGVIKIIRDIKTERDIQIDLRNLEAQKQNILNA